MRRASYDVINYIDDFVGIGTSRVACDANHHLLILLSQLGLDVSTNKLAQPATKVTCLGVVIDSIKCTIEVPPDKLECIMNMILDWKQKRSCTKKPKKP